MVVLKIIALAILVVLIIAVAATIGGFTLFMLESIQDTWSKDEPEKEEDKDEQ